MIKIKDTTFICTSPFQFPRKANPPEENHHVLRWARKAGPERSSWNTVRTVSGCMRTQWWSWGDGKRQQPGPSPRRPLCRSREPAHDLSRLRLHLRLRVTTPVPSGTSRNLMCSHVGKHCENAKVGQMPRLLNVSDLLFKGQNLRESFTAANAAATDWGSTPRS